MTCASELPKGKHHDQNQREHGALSAPKPPAPTGHKRTAHNLSHRPAPRHATLPKRSDTAMYHTNPCNMRTSPWQRPDKQQEWPQDPRQLRALAFDVSNIASNLFIGLRAPCWSRQRSHRDDTLTKCPETRGSPGAPPCSTSSRPSSGKKPKTTTDVTNAYQSFWLHDTSRCPEETRLFLEQSYQKLKISMKYAKPPLSRPKISFHWNKPELPFDESSASAGRQTTRLAKKTQARVERNTCTATPSKKEHRRTLQCVEEIGATFAHCYCILLECDSPV